MNDQALIVGIDPGSTSAIAGLNLNGDLVLLESRREFPREQIIIEIIESGIPVVISCDTEKMPSTVEKIASSLGAEKFEPEEDLERRKKKQLGEQGENSHEKDAIASAINAYNNMQRKIRKINKYSEEISEKRAKIAKRYFSRESEPGIKDLNKEI